VFPLTGDRRRQYGPATVGRIVSEIGKKAGVIVIVEKGKIASAQYLRRSVGTRWAGRIKPAILQLLMRHVSIETTMTNFVRLRFLAKIAGLRSPLPTRYLGRPKPGAFYAVQRLRSKTR